MSQDSNYSRYSGEKYQTTTKHYIHDDSYQSSLMIRARERCSRAKATTSWLGNPIVRSLQFQWFVRRVHHAPTRQQHKRISACLKLLTRDALNSRWLKPRDIKAKRYPSSRSSAHLLLSYMAVLRGCITRIRRYRAPKFLLVRACRRRRRTETTSRNRTLKLPRGSDAKESRDNFLRLDIYARSPSMLPGPKARISVPFENPWLLLKHILALVISLRSTRIGLPSWLHFVLASISFFVYGKPHISNCLAYSDKYCTIDNKKKKSNQLVITR